jgi:enoyl-CoA hydratase/carnithine racemase
MEHFKYTLEENVAVVTMSSGENRFNFDFFTAFHQQLDKIETMNQVNVLVVNSAHEKIWSNGIDLEWISGMMAKEGPGFFETFAAEMYRLFIRILTFPMITFAAISGHAFAGGAIMACAFDFRYMRSDRGWFCFPEIDIKIPFTPVLNAIALKAIPIGKLNEMQLTGERLTAQECQNYNIVKKVFSLAALLPEILTYAKTLNKDRHMIKTMKQMQFADIVKLYQETIEKHQKSV